jgi:hypothetical protein
MRNWRTHEAPLHEPLYEYSLPPASSDTAALLRRGSGYHGRRKHEVPGERTPSWPTDTPVCPRALPPSRMRTRRSNGCARVHRAALARDTNTPAGLHETWATCTKGMSEASCWRRRILWGRRRAGRALASARPVGALKGVRCQVW